MLSLSLSLFSLSIPPPRNMQIECSWMCDWYAQLPSLAVVNAAPQCVGCIECGLRIDFTTMPITVRHCVVKHNMNAIDRSSKCSLFCAVIVSRTNRTGLSAALGSCVLQWAGGEQLLEAGRHADRRSDHWIAHLLVGMEFDAKKEPMQFGIGEFLFVFTFTLS